MLEQTYAFFPSWHKFKNSIWMEIGFMHSEMFVNSHFHFSLLWNWLLPRCCFSSQKYFLRAWCLLICPWCAGWCVYSSPWIYIQPSLNLLHCLLTFCALILPLSCTSINWQWVLVQETYFTNKKNHTTHVAIILAFAHQLYPWITSGWLLCHLSYVTLLQVLPLIENKMLH